MATSYDPSLPTDRDRIRFLVRDTSAVFRFQNEEIEFYILEESTLGTEPVCVQYEVAILLLSRILSDMSQSGASSGVDDVRRIEYATGEKVEFGKGSWTVDQIKTTIQEYRMRAAKCANRKPNRYLRAMGSAPDVSTLMPFSE